MTPTGSLKYWAENGGTSVGPTHEQAPGGARLIYFSNTFSIPSGGWLPINIKPG
jgi:hypothetical protein